MKIEPWSPEDLFKPSEKYPQGSSGELLVNVDGTMVQKIYKDGKLIATKVFQNKMERQ